MNCIFPIIINGKEYESHNTDITSLSIIYI